MKQTILACLIPLYASTAAARDEVKKPAPAEKAMKRASSYRRITVEMAMLPIHYYSGSSTTVGQVHTWDIA